MKREVIRNESRDTISEGMLVVLLLVTYRERLLISRVDELQDQTLKITWLHGHWMTLWSVCK